MGALSGTIAGCKDKMEKCIEHLKGQFSALRTGKASPALVDNLTVPYYGVPTKLRELANISTPEARLIVINAFDPSVLKEIEKTIIAANLGVTPLNDGRVIRVPIPELSQERRAEIIKVAKRYAEEARVAIRNIRRDTNEEIKNIQKGGKATEDERDQALKDIQKSTDDFIKKVDDTMAAKEKELMVV